MQQQQQQQSQDGKQAADPSHIRAPAAGQAYCISNGPSADPSRQCIDVLLQMRPEIKSSFLNWKVLTVIAGVVQWINATLKERAPNLGQLNDLTPVTLRVCRLRYLLKSTKARDELGYTPVFTHEQAMRRILVEHNRNTLL
eukprot:m.99769 g.99769  ORF g.99769 m.99769 type:complete len:141 (+) comp15601_c0_seq2:1-423(+)